MFTHSFEVWKEVCFVKGIKEEICGWPWSRPPLLSSFEKRCVGARESPYRYYHAVIHYRLCWYVCTENYCRLKNFLKIIVKFSAESQDLSAFGLKRGKAQCVSKMNVCPSVRLKYLSAKYIHTHSEGSVTMTLARFGGCLKKLNPAIKAALLC